VSSAKHFSELSPAAERLVDVAQALIQRGGYNGFSYEDIAREVGIKKPSIHHHFPTKAELVAVVTQRYLHRFREALLRIEGQHARAPERLQAYAELFQQTYGDQRQLCLCGMLGAEADAVPAEVAHEVQQFFKANMAWLAEVIAQGQQQGSLRAGVDPAAQAQLLLCALEGAMVVGRAAGSAVHHGPAALGAALVLSLRA
jgi:TetR/AcrR family transcriptional repressor of nem operon